MGAGSPSKRAVSVSRAADDPSQAGAGRPGVTAGVGCGAYSRDQLELAAVARADPDAPVEAGLGEHLTGCPPCRALVDREAEISRLMALRRHSLPPDLDARHGHR